MGFIFQLKRYELWRKSLKRHLVCYVCICLFVSLLDVRGFQLSQDGILLLSSYWNWGFREKRRFVLVWYSLRLQIVMAVSLEWNGSRYLKINSRFLLMDKSMNFQVSWNVYISWSVEVQINWTKLFCVIPASVFQFLPFN